MIYFAFILVSVPFFIVLDCNNVKSSIMKVNVLKQMRVKHQNIQSAQVSFPHDRNFQNIFLRFYSDPK